MNKTCIKSSIPFICEFTQRQGFIPDKTTLISVTEDMMWEGFFTYCDMLKIREYIISLETQKVEAICRKANGY